jgi:hypothetical protein
MKPMNRKGQEVDEMRKRWLFAPLVVGLLALALGAGAVMAQGDGDGSSLGAKTFASRVAAILGLDEGQVQDALTQAAGEAREEHLQMKLDRMVEQGKITQEQADEYLLWFEAKPDGIMSKSRFHGHGRHGGFGGRMFGGHFSHGDKSMCQAPEEGTGQSFFGSGLSANPYLAQ